MGKKGLHNTLEPAYFSKPIIIGKNYQKFEEANPPTIIIKGKQKKSSFNNIKCVKKG